VELAVALHYVYQTPHDRLLWDVGHQAHPHKVLTGRRGAAFGRLGYSCCANSKLPGHIHQVNEGGGVHLFHDPASMCLYGNLTDIKLESDLLVHQPFYDESHDLALALGQRGEPLL
jgi:hypothetical protein